MIHPDHHHDVVVALFRQRQNPQVVGELENVCQEVDGDGRAVGLLQVQLLDVGDLLQRVDGGHQHAVDVVLGPEPLQPRREEQRNVLDDLAAGFIEVTGDLD